MILINKKRLIEWANSLNSSPNHNVYRGIRWNLVREILIVHKVIVESRRLMIVIRLTKSNGYYTFHDINVPDHTTTEFTELVREYIDEWILKQTETNDPD